ncbi:MAG: tetratricopeptide repeat protein, partial [Planctomycetota bacterium]
NNRFAFKEAAALHERMGDVRGAIEMMLRAVQLAPDDAKLNCALAKKCRQAGQIDRAIRYYRVALKHEDDFRQKSRILRYLYDMHTSQGTLDSAVEEYEEAVQGNPYDVESQLALAHFLLFHNDHVEALQKIEAILRFVPQDIDLRWMLVEIHAALEEHEAAIAECRRMLDIPKINSDAVHERIGKCYFALGKRAEASGAWNEIGALGKRAKLLDAHEMPEEAIAVFRELITSQPMDPKHYKGLAKVFVSRDRSEEALEVLGRLLVLDPDDIHTLGSIGEIHARAGRRDEALEIGRKVIGVLRKDREDDEDEDEDDVRPAYWRSYRYYRYQYQQASPVTAAREYFFKNGLRKEFVGILFEEVRSRPDNIALAFEALGAFGGEEGIEKCVELLRSLVGREIDISRVPKAMRYGDPKAMLWSRLQSVLQAPALKEKALAEYRAKVEAGEALPRPQDYVIFAGLLSSENRLDEALAALEEGMRRVAGAEILRAHRAAVLMRTKRYADAAEEYRAILEAGLERPPFDVRKLLDEQMKNVFNSLPARQRAVVRDEHRRYMRSCLEQEIRQGYGMSAMTRPPGRAFCRRRLAYAYYKLGRGDEARKLIEAQMPGDVRSYAPYGQLAAVCVEGEDEELSLRVFEAALAHWEFIQKWLPGPLVQQFEWRVKQQLGDLSLLAQLYLKRKEHLKAYDVLRRHGSQDRYYYGGGGEREAVFAFIKRHDIADELVLFYRTGKDEAAEAYKRRKAALGRFPTREEHDAFQRARNRVVEEGIALAEVHQSGSDYAAAAAEYVLLLELDPDFAELYKVLSILRKKQKDYAAAAKAQEGYIAYIQARQADPNMDEDRIAPSLRPTMPQDEERTQRGSRYRRYRSSYYGGYSPWQRPQQWGPQLAGAYHDLAWVYLKAEEKGKALAALASYVERARTSAEEAFVNLTQFAEESGLKDEVFALQKSLAGRNPHNLSLNMLYLGVLKERKRPREALTLARAMQRSTRATASSQQHLAQLAEMIEDLGRHTGAAPAPQDDLAPEAIRRRAEENPGDPVAQVRLAKVLYTETSFPEALRVTDAVVAQAPHHPENMALREKLFEVLDMDDAWVAYKRERLAKLKVDARFPIYKELAEHFRRRGLADDAAGMFKKMVDPKNDDDLNTALAGLVRMRRYGEVLEAFGRMEGTA